MATESFSAEEAGEAPTDPAESPADSAENRVGAATESLQTVDVPEENSIIPRFPKPEEP